MFQRRMNAEALKAAGWKSSDATGFTANIAPLWFRTEGDDMSIGFLAEADHCNNNPNNIHGGALMTFADIALGFRGAKAFGGTNLVTAQLQVNFVSAPHIGDFISCTPELVRLTKQLIFLRGLIKAGDRTVASADGIWKIQTPRPEAGQPEGPFA